MNLFTFGGAVKALGEGKFEAPLVLFTDSSSPDLAGDYFTKDTNFWYLRDGKATIPVLYNHGTDKTMGVKGLGSAEVEMRDAGVWMRGQLDMADQYQRAIYSMIEAGKMGTSSGSVPHMVEREQKGDAYWIKSWPLAEGSLTPTPCEPKLYGKVVAAKSVEVAVAKALKAESAEQLDAIADDLFLGIGAELICSGLEAMFRRIVWSAWELFEGVDPSTGKDRVLAAIAEFSAYATRYVSALVPAIAGEEASEGESPNSRFDLEAEEAGMKRLLGKSVRPSDVKSFERFLRDAGGFSRSEAKTIASYGFKGPQGQPSALRDAALPTKHAEELRAQVLRESIALSGKTSAARYATLETKQ